MKMNPNDFNALVDLYKSGKTKEVEDGAKSLIKKFPKEIIIHNLLGAVYLEMKKLDLARKSFEKALEINPRYSEAYNNLGIIFQKKGKNKNAISSYKKAIENNQVFHKAHYNLAIAYQELGAFPDAIYHYKKTYEIDNNFGEALINYWYLNQFCCDWKNQSQMKIELKKYINDCQSDNSKQCIKPFPLLSIFDDPELHFIASKLYSKNKIINVKKFNKTNSVNVDKKLRIAYVSSDFKNHPFSYLTAGLLENHDTDNFEIYCISSSKNDKSDIQNRIKRACKNFIDVSNKNNFEIAKLINDLSINIIVDCGGYTKESKIELYSYLPNIPKIGFLGYPGTLGGNINQYIIADKIVIPENQKINFSEKIIYLPDSYYPTDNKAKIDKNPISRKECLLPKNSFVFCCFNQSYKITPEIFNTWMEILNQIENSVLWLMSSNKWAQSNLRQIASSKGINKNRIIFAKKVSNQKHLSRIKNADLFLDTFPYNGHTTACDSLFMHVPVLTIKGKSFASRVATSLLSAIGIGELATENLKEYRFSAIELAKSKPKILSYKEKLMINKSTYPLFNTKLYTKNLEKKFLEIWSKTKK